MSVTEQQLAAAGIPRRCWTVGAKESSRPAISAIVTNLQAHFVDGDGFVLEGKDYVTRNAVASWLGIRAMETPNAWFRDKWHSDKPTEAHSKTVPFTVMMADVDALVKARFAGQFDSYTTHPDIFLLSELGSEAISYTDKRVSPVKAGKFSYAEVTRQEGEYTPGVVVSAIDSFFRLRFNAGLVTIVTLSRELSTDYSSATTDILASFTKVTL